MSEMSTDARQGAHHPDATVDLDEARRRIQVVCPAERRIIEPMGQVALRLVGPGDSVEAYQTGWLLLFRGAESLSRCRLAARELRSALVQLGCRTKIARDGGV